MKREMTDDPTSDDKAKKARTKDHDEESLSPASETLMSQVENSSPTSSSTSAASLRISNPASASAPARTITAPLFPPLSEDSVATQKLSSLAPPMNLSSAMALSPPMHGQPMDSRPGPFPERRLSGVQLRLFILHTIEKALRVMDETEEEEEMNHRSPTN